MASATASFILDEGMPNVLANAPFDLEVSISRGHLGLPSERLVAMSSANPRLPLFAFQFGFTEREPTDPIEVGGLSVRGESAEGPPTVGDCGIQTPWLVTISGDSLPATVSVSTGADVTVEGAQLSVDIS